MVILIDILHPAHVHFFRNVHHRLRNDNHDVIVTARSKEMSIALLREYAIPHTMISRQRTGIGLVFEMILRTFRLFMLCVFKRPDLMMGIMGPSIAVVGFVLRIPAWVFYDTENAWITNWFAYPLARRVYTPACYEGNAGKNQIRYAGYHELAYLHPALFTPDDSLLRRNGVDPAKPYSIVRFVSWQASHDIGEKGLPAQDKEHLISALEKYGVVYITSESPLPESLRSKRIPVTITGIHHLIAFAKLVVGESATMASEAAVLGVPAIFISDTSRGYTIEEEKKYGLVFNYTRKEFIAVLTAIDTVFQDQAFRGRIAAGRARLLRDKTDVTQYMYDEITRFTQRNA
jgi:hypothetical protein